MTIIQQQSHLWSLVLAGGDGRRMRPLIKQWLGREKPKQYCTFVGTRSMFQHTVDRADTFAPPERRVTVAASSHRHDVMSQLDGRHPGILLFQPANRDTAAGLFLGVASIRARDPFARIAVFPSDHYVAPECVFVDTVRCAAATLDFSSDRIVMLGCVPDHPETDYGWIQPGGEIGGAPGLPVQAVRRFVEKPCAEEAASVMAEGGLWNTFVFVARAETLWNLGWQYVPDVLALIDSSHDTPLGETDPRDLEQIYRRMPALNFSSELLARAASSTAVMELRDVAWSDWGRPERIAEALASLERQPSFRSGSSWNACELLKRAALEYVEEPTVWGSDG